MSATPPVPTAKQLLEWMAKNMNRCDYFELLRLQKTATPEEIKRAFYRLSRAYHPDRFLNLNNPPLKAVLSTVYKRVTEAYAVLRDDAKRTRYLADVTGPERALKLRFTEAAEDEARAHLKRESEEQIGNHPKGRHFYTLALADLEAERFPSAERNLKMAVTYEPENARYKAALDSVRARARSGTTTS